MDRDAHDPYDVLRGAGVMAQPVRELDWTRTDLGAIDEWSPRLATAANICLTSRFPMVLWWGPSYTMLYNEAYIPTLGDKHPAALGRPGEEIWPEIWDTIGPMLDRVRHDGEATWSDDLRLVVRRRGFTEESFFTFSFSPIIDDGEVAGVFTALSETTDRVLKDRRLRTVGAMADRSRQAGSVEDAAKSALAVLDALPQDVPFGALYLTRGLWDGDEDRARLVATCGDQQGFPSSVDLDADPTPWRLQPVIATGRAEVVSRETGGGEEASRAITLPLADPATGRAGGALVVGLSPHQRFDDDYRDFVHLVADQTTKAIVDARAAVAERERATALAELDDAKTRFFSNVSHEFRTPLTLLQGPVEEALADTEHPLGRLQRDRLEMVKRNAERMGKLVNSLLDLSRLESGRVNASYQATDLAALTRELSSMFPSATDRLGLEYEVDVDPLPRPVYVDQEMWEKIVYNLLSNAIKFTLDGRISVRLRHDGDHAQLEVSDTGVGIPEEELPHLFERFHRIRHTHARSQEGTGIGLALVRELVQLHGGRIQVDSELDRGTTFTIRVPYGNEHLPGDQTEPPGDLTSTTVAGATYLDEVDSWGDEEQRDAALAADARETSGARILIVDDNADMRRYLERILGTQWDVESATSGDRALERAREDRPDLILTDVIMPGLDGFALLEEVRADPELHDVPVVLLTARASEASRVEGLDGGADDYLIKPFTVGELTARVRSNLRLATQRLQTADVRARQAMLAGLSHEMQTPLAAILGSVSILEQGEFVAETAPALNILRRQANQLRGLVQHFLDFSRFEAGRAPVLQITEYEPDKLITAAIEVCGNPRVEVVESAADLPRVHADADRVEQILTNLCTNALKFSPQETTVRIGARRGEGDTVVFEVVDRGVGIPPDEAEHIFDKFFRGRSGNEVDGTGLGLYVSRELAHAMGGDLRLRPNDSGQGAVFELTLPAAG